MAFSFEWATGCWWLWLHGLTYGMKLHVWSSKKWWGFNLNTTPDWKNQTMTLHPPRLVVVPSQN